MYMIAIHPVLQYCYVIARDLPVIGVIVRKIGGLQESWWISRANTFTGIGSKSQQFSCAPIQVGLGDCDAIHWIVTARIVEVGGLLWLG